MNQKLFVHVPAHLLPSRLNFLINRHLQPEIACQEISIDKLDFVLLKECADKLAENQLKTTLHAPFAGFNPGSGSKRVRKSAYALAEKSLLLADAINAKKVIFHPGLPPGSSERQLSAWLKYNIDFWPNLIARSKAIDCCICIENIYDTVPETLVQLCREMNSDNFGHCFDIGHWNIFGAVKLLNWLDQVAPDLKHLHLHDNCGDQDEHLPIGLGDADFSALFSWLRENNCAPTLTLEAHNLPDLEISLSALKRYLPA